jgi:DNA-binding transcriptional LysR family regulator
MYLAAAVAMVRAGLGYTILPATAIEWRAHPGLAVKLVDDPAFVRSVGIIRKPGRSLSPPSEAFAQALVEEWRIH